MVIHLNLTAKPYVNVAEAERKIILPEETVTLNLATSIIASEYVVTVQNGDRHYETKGMVVNLPTSIIKEGILLITICGIIRGKTAIKWSVDPIHLVAVDGGYDTIPEVAALNARVSALTDTLNETTERLENALIELQNLINEQNRM